MTAYDLTIDNLKIVSTVTITWVGGHVFEILSVVLFGIETESAKEIINLLGALVSIIGALRYLYYRSERMKLEKEEKEQQLEITKAEIRLMKEAEKRMRKEEGLDDVKD